MHKDLSDHDRAAAECLAEAFAADLHDNGQSLAIAREAWINAFDKAAEELDAG